MKKFWSKSIAMLLAVVMVLGFVAGFGPQLKVDAAGFTSDGYYLITSAYELDLIRNNLGGKYRLGSDIDLSTYYFNTETWSNTKGWKPIGQGEAAGFSGILDGAGYTIKGLWSHSQGDNAGLFGWMVGGTVKNLNIELASGRGITGAGERKGALAGNAYKGSLIENVHVKGGGYGSEVHGSANYIAGLVGVVKASTVNSCSVSNLHLEGGSYVGGIAGIIYDGSSVNDCHVDYVNVLANASYAGGFIGCIYGGSKVKDSTVNEAQVSAYASYAGGFVGAIHEKGSSISGSHVDTADVKVKSSYVAGFAGVVYNYATVERSYVRYANATAVKGRSAGGFAGDFYDYAKAYRCYVIGIDAKSEYYAGGWAGAIYGHATVDVSCAYGFAETTLGYVAGGFAGYAAHTNISNCYAQVDATCKVSGGIGGFAGYLEVGSTLYNTYSAGNLKDHMGDNAVYNGGYSGYTYANFTGTNYYDNQLSVPQRPYGTGGVKSGSYFSYPQGYNTATMKKQATFVGWNFDTIWRIDEDITYPYFWEMGEVQTAEPVIDTIEEGDRTVRGSGIAGAYIQLTYPNGSSSYAVVAAGGTWISIVPAGVNLVEGDIVSAIQWKENWLPSNRVYTTVIKNQSEVPTINDVYEDDVTVSGSGVPNASITVTFHDGTEVSATVSPDGTWSVSVPDSVEIEAGQLVDAVQTEARKKPSDKVVTTVLASRAVLPDAMMACENTTGEMFAVAGDIIEYSGEVWNNGTENSVWENASIIISLNEDTAFRSGTVKINGRTVAARYYTYNSTEHTLTIYLGDYVGGLVGGDDPTTVTFEFKVRVNTDISDVRSDLMLEYELPQD